MQATTTAHRNSMAPPAPLLLLASLLLLRAAAVAATDYDANAEIPLYANKIGPYHNPSEQYEYFTIPICEPSEEERKWHNLGEAIGGDRLVKTRALRPRARCAARESRVFQDSKSSSGKKW